MPQQDSLHLEGIACCIGQACAALKTIVQPSNLVQVRPSAPLHYAVFHGSHVHPHMYNIASAVFVRVIRSPSQNL